ncbi:MarR family winged helix-turn-helix transcriptional regulator [Paenibacillus flagellatus]|uniref:MarR family transcriptional regulator n=1 Tax=Paenibacillus flagellatus TaxID=2211139 RepID=A0A2V5KDK8_9BACL|nr:MarR family transcriptional regulator [Paenibacillus flagellatus]PYI56294.1 MarR family transcriptional regulator [Paenibacillus flagellatus]
MTTPGNESLQLFVVLSRAYQWVNAHGDRHIRKLGLNPTEFGVLELLYHKGRQPLQQIGGKILMTSGNITYVVDKLEKKELVVRVGCPEDRRVWYAEMTDKGKAFIEQSFPAHTTVIEKAVEGLTPDERRQAIELLKKLGRHAENTFK